MDVAVGCILGEEKGAEGDICPQELVTLRHIKDRVCRSCT